MLTTIVATDIDGLLPQTQCGKCTYPGCLPYAEAVLTGENINKCLPGGQETVDALARLLHVDTLPLDTEHPAEAVIPKYAYIREAECIGCTKCIQACPVDAILGAAKRMHTVIIQECTGCDLCIEPCPVDCIDLLPFPTTESTTRQLPSYFRNRFNARNERLAQNAASRSLRTTAREHTIAVTAIAAPSSVLEKLQRGVEGAYKRVTHAQQKVDIARQYHPEKLMPLLARLQDLQYKYDEATRKLAAYNAGENRAPEAGYIADLLARAKLARGNLTDGQRLQRALELVKEKIRGAETALQTAEAQQDINEDLLRNQLKKLTDKLQALQQEISEQEIKHIMKTGVVHGKTD